ncbi:MAG TPA: hypothetical protein VF459_02800 [Caulobacteraceae bacterium]
MRLLALASALFLIDGAAAVAQPAPPPLPKAFAEYGQPDITPGLCKTVSPAEVQCIIPAMTAGQYLIEATGTSTSQGADAKQALQITIGAVPCGSGHNTAPWPSGARTFRLNCSVSVLTDRPLVVRVLYQDVNATKDPNGPQLSIRRQPWEGVLNSRIFVPQQ